MFCTAWWIGLLQSGREQNNNFISVVICVACGTMPERLMEMLMDTWTPLIILWITVLPSIYMAPMNQSQVIPSGSSTGLKRLNEEQRVLNRSKRGWVWNQMFVLEEFSGPEPILVGRVRQELVCCFFFFLWVCKCIACEGLQPFALL